MDYHKNPDEIAATWSPRQIAEWSEYQQVRSYEQEQDMNDIKRNT